MTSAFQAKKQADYLGSNPGRRIFNMKYNRFFRREYDEHVRDFSAFGSFLILIIIFSLFLKGKQFLAAIAGLLITSGIGNIIKLLFHKKRPKHIHYSNTLERIQSGSFPSIHSANIMYAGLVIIRNYNSFIVDAIFTLVILLVGYSRCHLKKHFLKDVIGGYIIGILVFLGFYIFKLTIWLIPS